LELAGCALISCSEGIDQTASGRLLHGMLAAVNEYHSRNMGDEIRRKTLAKVQNGGTAGKAPLGYLNKQDGIDVRYVVTDPERAPLITWAYEAYATGDWTIRQLLGELTRKGLRTRASKRTPSKELGPSQLQHILTNPYYKGVIRFTGVDYAGKHDPLINADTWQLVQDMLASKANGQKERVHHHYLKGSLFCGHCGSPFMVSHSRDRRGIVHPYFMCLGRHQKRTDCTLKARPIEIIEALVAQHYLQVCLGAQFLKLTQEALLDELRHEQELAADERQRQELRMRQLRDERETLLRAHYAGAVPLDLLKAEQARLSRELVDAEALLTDAAVAVERVETTLRRAIELADDCHEAYAIAVPFDRKLMNQAFFKKLFITERGIIRWELNEPFASLLDERTHGFLLALNAAQTAAEAEAAVQQANGKARLGVERPYERRRPSWWAGTSWVKGSKQEVLVEVPGFEPGSFSVLTGLLRAQPLVCLGPAFATGAGGGPQPPVGVPG